MGLLKNVRHHRLVELPLLQLANEIRDSDSSILDGIFYSAALMAIGPVGAMMDQGEFKENRKRFTPGGMKSLGKLVVVSYLLPFLYKPSHRGIVSDLTGCPDDELDDFVFSVFAERAKATATEQFWIDQLRAIWQTEDATRINTWSYKFARQAALGVADESWDVASSLMWAGLITHFYGAFIDLLTKELSDSG